MKTKRATDVDLPLINSAIHPFLAGLLGLGTIAGWGIGWLSGP
jgi:hypothetical protein